jgi:copper resistance protein B
MKHVSEIRGTLARSAIALACTTPASYAGAQETQPVEDSPIRSYVLIDQLEHTTTREKRGNQDGLRVNSTAWIGGDYNRLWIYAEANKPNDGKLEDVDVQFLYGRLVAPFWDLQAGLRYTKPGPGIPSHTYAVVGVQGLAPYRFGVQAAAFISERGKVSGRAEIEYDLLLTQRWVLQPRFATNIALQEVKERGIGRGVNDIEFGLRLRYEVKREFAPYMGLAWQKRYGRAAEFAQDRGERSVRWSLLAGLRVWF